MRSKDFQEEFEAVLARCQRLKQENHRLRRLLFEHGIPLPPQHTGIPPAPPTEAGSGAGTVNHRSSPEAKIALFRSVFRGREDVYAVRWESRNGRHGYMPAAERDWKTYLASAPEERRKVDRQTRKLLPLTDEVIRKHLAGEITAGIYPLLSDETCWFLAVDFDKKTWQLDAAAFLATCHAMGVPAALERSRSGRGGHVWIFFESAIPAATARKLGCSLLTRTMECRHQVGLDSYDRLFPNQDTMPKGGLGNLIALPLQKLPREVGNSLFVDAEFNPYPDQWSFLATIHRMSSSVIEGLVEEAARRGDVIGVRISLTDQDQADPWTLPPSRKRLERPVQGPLHERVHIVRANLLYT